MKQESKIKKMKRTPQETVEVIEKVVSQITLIEKAAMILNPYSFFDDVEYRETGRDQLIEGLCRKYKIDEHHVRKVLQL